MLPELGLDQSSDPRTWSRGSNTSNQLFETYFDENKCSSHLAGPESFVDGLFSPFQLGKRVHNIGKNEGGTNCVMKIGGLRAQGRKFFLLCDRGIFFMQLFFNICYYYMQSSHTCTDGFDLTFK